MLAKVSSVSFRTAVLWFKGLAWALKNSSTCRKRKYFEEEIKEIVNNKR